MTAREMLIEMFDKGYASQYTVEEFEEWFTLEQIEKFYNSFMNFLKNRGWYILNREEIHDFF